mmetsp:Transcript_15476/g.31806  ORF Transcript_15476/g.31806 Transcript_15476/m.31806 type:complete len:119 (-) Transcript_15476:289-645(-)|eukprot:CAMPEP_0171610402 /NCGR_PEP_ID=MMETSP0990-20121206/10033_1 /TAXON_ID=483369 /ORGANISM="non described non described, Strain CCMP2098" /LENGTH=118 /DNA_ID=CAMNT_0012173815 /DNA_START=151 /DNA_END=507 /DNA_ORIENTATION=-
MAHRLIWFFSASSSSAKTTAATAGVVLLSTAVGFGALALVEGGNPVGNSRVQAAAREQAARALSDGVDTATARQNAALAEMLRGLKNKSFREKVEAAADAQDRFMEPQNYDGGGFPKQ